MSRRLVTLVAASAALAVAIPAIAAPKQRTMSGTYKAEAAAPDPSGFALADGDCEPTLAQAKHERKIDLPAAGTLQVDLTGFQGDWDLAVLNSKGQTIQSSAQDLTTEPIDKPEKVKAKIKAKGTYIIRACNFAGGPSANVKWLHTYMQ